MTRWSAAPMVRSSGDPMVRALKKKPQPSASKEVAAKYPNLDRGVVLAAISAGVEDSALVEMQRLMQDGMLGPSDHRSRRPSGHRTIGSADHRIIGPSDHRIIGRSARQERASLTPTVRDLDASAGASLTPTVRDPSQRRMQTCQTLPDGRHRITG